MLQNPKLDVALLSYVHDLFDREAVSQVYMKVPQREIEVFRSGCEV
jgi:hypothetical protein